MKKILFIIVVTFFVGFNVEAYESKNVYCHRDLNNYCDEEGNVYNAYVLMYKSRPMYFLNISDNYNLSWSDYYKISIKDTDFPSDIKKYAATGIYSTNDYYNAAIHLLLWQKLYPEKQLKMCNDTNYKRLYIKQSQDMITDILKGPAFDEEVLFQKVNELYEYEYTYLNYFKLIDSNELDINIKGTKMQVIGNTPGEYEIVFKRRNVADAYDDMILTDGTNYLLVHPSVTDEEYKVKIIIEDEINNDISEEIIPEENIQEDVIVPSDEENAEEIVVVEPSLEQEESLIIEVEDTFYISYIIIALGILGIYFVLHKKI